MIVYLMSIEMSMYDIMTILGDYISFSSFKRDMSYNLKGLYGNIVQIVGVVLDALNTS